MNVKKELEMIEMEIKKIENSIDTMGAIDEDKFIIKVAGLQHRIKVLRESI